MQKSKLSKYYETPGFKELQAEWDKKLEAAGFVDQEKTVGTERVLVQKASNVYRNAPEVVRDSKSAYFDQISKCAQQEEFKDEVEKLVMTRVSEGVHIKEICEELKILNNPRCRGYRQTVRFIIRHYENKWGIKTWKPEQLKIKQWKRKS